MSWKYSMYSDCHTFLLNSIPESNVFWCSPQILGLCPTWSLWSPCLSTVLRYKRNLCAHTFFHKESQSHLWLIPLLKVLCFSCHQILSFFFFPPKRLMIYSQACTSYPIQQSLWISLPPGHPGFDQWMLGWALEVASPSSLTFAWSQACALTHTILSGLTPISHQIQLIQLVSNWFSTSQTVFPIIYLILTPIRLLSYTSYPTRPPRNLPVLEVTPLPLSISQEEMPGGNNPYPI